jgi:hypothetical protein
MKIARRNYRRSPIGMNPLPARLNVAKRNHKLRVRGEKSPQEHDQRKGTKNSVRNTDADKSFTDLLILQCNRKRRLLEYNVAERRRLCRIDPDFELHGHRKPPASEIETTRKTSTKKNHARSSQSDTNRRDTKRQGKLFGTVWRSAEQPRLLTVACDETTVLGNLTTSACCEKYSET